MNKFNKNYPIITLFYLIEDSLEHIKVLHYKYLSTKLYFVPLLLNQINLTARICNKHLKIRIIFY